MSSHSKKIELRNYFDKKSIESEKLCTFGYENVCGEMGSPPSYPQNHMHTSLSLSCFTRFMDSFFVPADRRLFNINNSIPPDDAVYIGRTSPWGNPYRLSEYTHEEAIRLYEVHLYESGLINKLHLLNFKKLACFCHPNPCHGDILLKHLDKIESPM